MLSPLYTLTHIHTHTQTRTWLPLPQGGESMAVMQGETKAFLLAVAKGLA